MESARLRMALFVGAPEGKCADVSVGLHAGLLDRMGEREVLPRLSISFRCGTVCRLVAPQFGDVAHDVMPLIARFLLRCINRSFVKRPASPFTCGACHVYADCSPFSVWRSSCGSFLRQSYERPLNGGIPISGDFAGLRRADIKRRRWNLHRRPYR